MEKFKPSIWGSPIVGKPIIICHFNQWLPVATVFQRMNGKMDGLFSKNGHLDVPFNQSSVRSRSFLGHGGPDGDGASRPAVAQRRRGRETLRKHSEVLGL